MPAVFGLLAAAAGLSGPSAFGWMIGNLPQAGLPPQSCRMVLSLPQTEEDARKRLIHQVTCSGTIIGSSFLMTAAHCFHGRTFTEGIVECPGDTPKRIKSWTLPREYTAPKNPMEVADTAKLDLAVARIDGEFEAVPVPLPGEPSDVTRLFAYAAQGRQPDCSLYGYGENETGEAGEHNGRSVAFERWKTGTLIHTQSDRRTGKVISERREDILEWWSEPNLTLYFRAEAVVDGKTLSAVRSGDSGGGLFCRDEAGHPVLMGVTSGHSTQQDASGRPVHVGAITSLAHRLEVVWDLMSQNAARTRSHRPLPQGPQQLAVHGRRTTPPATHRVLD